MSHYVQYAREIYSIDGPIVAQFVYEEIMRGDVLDADAVAYALDFAVRKLREDRGRGMAQGWASYIHIGA